MGKAVLCGLLGLAERLVVETSVVRFDDGSLVVLCRDVRYVK